MRRGEIWWASLPTPAGSGPGLRRPVLIVQANAFNESRLGTVIVAAITGNLSREHAPGNVRLPPAESGLAKASVVNVSQLLAVDRGYVTQRVAALPMAAMNRVDEGLRLALNLPAG